MTLLELRKSQLAAELRWLLQDAEHLREAVESDIDDAYGMKMLTSTLLNHAQLAAAYARQVEDLADIEKYGPGGGR